MADQTFWVEHGIADGAGTGLSADPWSIGDAFTTATTSGGNTTVNIKMPPGGSDVYQLDSPGVTVNGNGSTGSNYKLDFVGYNTNLGDIGQPGGAFYQSPLNAHISGITRGSAVPIHATVEAFPSGALILYNDREHLSFRNLHLKGNDMNDTALIKGGASAADGIVIHNCRFSTAKNAILPKGSLLHITDCFFESDFTDDQVDIESVTYGAIIQHCVFDIKATSWGLRFPKYGAYIGNNIFVNGLMGARDVREAIFQNNLFYNQTGVCIEGDTQAGVLVEQGNIFVPATPDAYAVLLPAGGDSILKSDFSLANPVSGAWSLTGTEFGWFKNPFNLQGNNSRINIDPQLVDPANKDYSLAAGSPCINAGPYSVNGVQRHIGPEMLTAGDGRRSRLGVYANIGRTSI